MVSTKRTVDSSLSGYKAGLKRLEELQGKAGQAVYDRVKIAVEVFEDRDFRADLGNLDDFKAADVLSEYLEDLCLEFLQLKSMLEYYPDRLRPPWSDGKLATGHQQMLEERGMPDQESIPRNRVSWKAEAEKLQKEVDRLTAELRSVRQENDELRKLIAQPVRA